MEIGKSKISASRLGLGTWAIGGGVAWGDNDDSKSVETIRNCVDMGVNFIDTAPAYNFGHSEEVVGQALKGIREKIVLATKCGLVWHTDDGSFFEKKEGETILRNLSKTAIKEEVEMSLKRLNTDYIDIYITHWQSIDPFFTPISDTMEALNELKQEGKIKAIGASNVNSDHIKEYLKHGQLDLIQEKYSIIDRKVEENGILELCKRNNITFQAYSPLEQGLLTGAINRDYVPPEGSARKGKKWFERSNMVNVIDMLEKWEDLSEKYNCTKANLAIAWVAAQGDFINVLFGARSVENMKENAQGIDIKLSPEDTRLMRDMAEELDLNI
ncbi:aldo/keto reductase [Alteribacillus sp. YIM 98480]|uniref:aldo/keto reductase n=1 Tax=Alteribacillus sp. YIM 98480 TaxID=2606599 RepID=UPI001E4F87B7|nr:aldo/keto reductase [Alteribacillus sp. YIM 98480]